MGTIKIVEKFQGQAMMRLLDEPWQKLIKLDEGTFSETPTTIEFKTTAGHKVTADKSSVYEDNQTMTSYMGSMNDIGGPQILVDKLKGKKDVYVLRSFYPGSFMVVLTTDANYQAPPELPFEINNIQFHSDDHIRYQDKKVAVTSSSDSQGHNKNANRGIQVEPNVTGGEGYTITIFNLDGDHPLWGNNVQMAPKQMKLISSDKEKIILRGYGLDAMGGSFADYGLTIFHNRTEPTKLMLHMQDRNVDIEYFKSNVTIKKEPEIIKLAKQAATEYQNENPSVARSYLVQIFRSIKGEPEQLKDVTSFETLGKAFLMMLDKNLSDDIDNLQMMASVGYLFISKAIQADKNNLNLYKDRLLLLRMGHESFVYTVMSALDLSGGSSFPFGIMASMAPTRARDAIYKMEIADLEQNPVLHQQVELFKERKKDFDEKIARQFFMPEKTKDNVIKTGVENHKRLLEYLENRIINESDVDF